ncbi:unnamed protein product [Effrenium voratum]|nr:unnamed protein product [Effrenium voratum]
MEDLDPGLVGYSDSGSDFHDLPEPELPKGIRKTRLAAAEQPGTLKRPVDGDTVVLRCRPCPQSLQHLEEEGLLRLDLSPSASGLAAAAKTLRLGEVARFHFQETREVTEVTLVDWIVRRDLFEDGSAIKSILRKPDDQRRPIIGQICQVSLSLAEESSTPCWTCELQHEIQDLPCVGHWHHTGWLLDKALLSMRRGERSSLRCSAQRLRGGATIELPRGDAEHWTLDLELHDFIESADVSFEKDGAVLKRSLHCRDAWPRCAYAGQCEVRATRAGEASEERVWHACCGAGELPEALEAAVLQMREGELAEVTAQARLCEPWLSSSATSDLTEEVFRLQVTKYTAGPWDVARGDEEKLAVLAERKDRAAKFHAAGRWRLAAYHFREVYELLGYIDDFRGVRAGQQRQQRVAALKQACLLNRSLSLIKAGCFTLALRSCDLALDAEPMNVKALLRRARARLGLDECDLAMADLRQLQGTEGEQEAQQLAKQVRQRQKVLDIDSKDLYARMCQSLGHLPHPLDID